MALRMKFRAALVAGVVTMGLAAAPPQAQAETLADTLVSAYRNSNLLDQNRALLRATDEDLVQAYSQILPVVSFIARANTNRSLAPDYTLNFGVTMEMPIYDFGRGRMGLDLASEQILSARAGLVVVEQRVLLNAVAAYLGLHSAIDTVALRRNNMALIEQQLRAARERFELGDSTRTDIAIAEARLASARSALAAAEGDVAVAREDFNFVVGRYPGQLSAPPRLPQLPSSLDAALARARTHHPAILQAQHQVSAAEIATQVARSQRYGSVTGSVGLSALHNSTTENTGSDVTASIGYSAPIFSGGRLPSVERQSIARHEAQRAALHQTVAQVNQAVASAWAQVAVARAQLAASGIEIEAAQAAYDAVSAEAELGTRTTLDVLNSEQELLDARSSRIFAAAALQQASYVLLESMGLLTVQGLNLGIPTYDVEAYSAALRGRGNAASQPSVQGQRLDRILNRYQAD